MTNIHITLVGGQTTPVYQGIVLANPDKVFLIYSIQTENEANRIYAEMDVECELRKFDPVDLKKIHADAEKLRDSFSLNDQISINVSSGTKPWALLFYDIFKDRPNATVVVVDQNNLCWNLKTHECSEVAFDMDVQFRLLGNELREYRNIEEYTESDKAAIPEIRVIRKFNFQDFNSMTEFLYRYPNENIATGKSGSVMTWISQKKLFECCMRDKMGRELKSALHSDHIRDLMLNTGWFEFEIALLLVNWNKTRQLRMNCIFPAKGGSPKNEIDIIVNTGSKLLFVECKTQIKNETDIDKFASAVKVYGGLGSKALFVTDARMTDKAIEKCADHGIMTFCLQTYYGNEMIEQVLFDKLERELFNLNTK